jgi:murein DD-endopeptidase MepM/ murein hydrolase activator NlpD
MKLIKPKTITQHFGENVNQLFYGGKGHSGVDYYVRGGYGHHLKALCDGVVTKVILGRDPRVDWCAIEITTEDNYLVGYGHVSGYNLAVGDSVKTGDIIATQGNGGRVASNGTPVSKADRIAGSEKGTHVHLYMKKDNKTLNPGHFFVEELKPKPTYPVLRKGDKGDNVKLIQTLLTSHEYTLIIDGDFGPATKGVVEDFQKERGLYVDGVVGSVTYAALFELN